LVYPKEVSDTQGPVKCPPQVTPGHSDRVILTGRSVLLGHLDRAVILTVVPTPHLLWRRYVVTTPQVLLRLRNADP